MIIIKRNRLSDYDYSQCGVYFVTICTKERKNLFWAKDNIVGASIARPNEGYVLSDMGKIAEDGIKNIPQYYPVNIDCYVVMPNHVHILMEIVADGEQCSPLHYRVLPANVMEMSGMKPLHYQISSDSIRVM